MKRKISVFWKTDGYEECFLKQAGSNNVLFVF